MTKVLFVCVHNSARSQMAEAFLKQHGGEHFAVESAGLEPGVLNPLVVAAMQEIGLDISQNKTKSVFEFFKQGRFYNYVITVCDGAQAGKCPIFPGATQILRWSFDDPAGFTGTWEEKLAKTRVVRDTIEAEVKAWIQSLE